MDSSVENKNPIELKLMKETGMILLEVIAGTTLNVTQDCSIAHHIADLSFSQFKELYGEDEKNQRVSEQN